MKSINHLIKYALLQNLTISVFDGECFEVKRSSKYKEILDCINSVDESEIKIRDLDGNFIAWALIIPSLDNEEIVADFSDNDFMNNWNDIYFSL